MPGCSCLWAEVSLGLIVPAQGQPEPLSRLILAFVLLWMTKTPLGTADGNENCLRRGSSIRRSSPPFPLFSIKQLFKSKSHSRSTVCTYIPPTVNCNQHIYAAKNLALFTSSLAIFHTSGESHSIPPLLSLPNFLSSI